MLERMMNEKWEKRNNNIEEWWKRDSNIWADGSFAGIAEHKPLNPK